jgi:serine/threonine protein kinase
MNWVNAGQFQIADRNGRHYVFRRNNSGNTEINIPASIVTKAQAKRWLKNNPNKVTKFKPKRVPVPKGFLSAFGPSYTLAAPMIPTENTGLGSPKYFNLNLPCDKFKASLKDVKAIGSGRQGKVFKASQKNRGEFVLKIAPYDLAAKSRNEPQPFQVEFDIQKAVMDVVPKGVVYVYKTFRCLNFVEPSELNMKNVQNSAKYDKSRQGIIIQEYCDGGSLADWIKKNPLSDSVFKKMISQIIGTLVEIRKKYPHFNHNDLHMENIFVSKARGFLIGDFGWARLKEKGTNPAVNTANGTQTASFWGVGPKTDPRYDAHFFLNELREWILRHEPSKYPRTVAFLDRVVPPGYRGMKDTHVGEWRLKYNDPCPGLPTLGAIMKDTYIKGVSKLAATKVKAPSPKKLKARRVTSPMLREAIARLKKKNYTNAELIALSAANFLKLSPKTRERAKKVRAGVNKKSVATEVVKSKKVAVTPNKLKYKPVPKEVLKSAKFNKLIEKIWKAQGGPANESFYNAWNRARTKAMNQVANRLAKNQPPFTPTPPKPKAPKVKTPSPPKAKAKTPSPIKPTSGSVETRKRFNYKLSPKSGRAKIRAPNSGRYVYANGSTISLEYLKGMAASMNVNIKGLRSKANIARKIFGL